MSKLGGKVAVITGATSGMALATAKLFVAEGAYVYITGRRADKLDEAVTAIGHPVTGVAGDAGNLHDLDRLVDTVHARPRPDTDLVATASGPYKEGNRLGEAGNEGRRSAPRGSSTRNSTTRQPGTSQTVRRPPTLSLVEVSAAVVGTKVITKRLAVSLAWWVVMGRTG